MNVVWHHHEGMQSIMPQGISVVLEGLDDHVCHRRLAQVEWTAAGFVEQAVQCGKCSSGTDCRRGKRSIGRQTIVETPREEDRPFRLPEVRKTSTVEHHRTIVSET